MAILSKYFDFSVSIVCGASVLGIVAPVAAQIIPDSTTATNVNPNQSIRGVKADLITGGIKSRGNLFHSFSEFNIRPSQAAYFQPDATIDNIFSRVTGRHSSSIMGRLGVLGNANLYLLNPNGILFGPDASLDLKGAFTASASQSFEFGQGSKFSASEHQPPPLVKLNIIPGAQLGKDFQGNIENFADLSVLPKQIISLEGQQIEHSGRLSAPGGSIQLLGNTIGLLENAQIDVSGQSGGGTVLIGGGFQGQPPITTSQRTFVGPDVQINASALQQGNGGNVVIFADDVTGFYGQILAQGKVPRSNTNSNSRNNFRGGIVEVSGKKHLIFRGDVNTHTQLGQPGALLLNPTTIRIAAGSQDQSNSTTDNFAGSSSGLRQNILVTPLSEFEQNTPTTIFESELEALSGNTDVTLEATDGIEIEQNLQDGGLTFQAGNGVISLNADADSDGVGDLIMMGKEERIDSSGRKLNVSGANIKLGQIHTTDNIGNKDSGLFTSKATGDTYIRSINTSNRLGRSGGNVKIDSNGAVDLYKIDTNSYGYNINSKNGGDIQISSRDSIRIGGDIDSYSSAYVSKNSKAASINSGRGGDIQISSRDSIRIDGDIDSYSSAYVSKNSKAASINSGRGGNIQISSRDSIRIDGDIDSYSSAYVSKSNTTANINTSRGGHVDIHGREVNLKSINTRSQINSTFFNQSISQDVIAEQGGDISISSSSGDLTVEGSLITSSRVSLYTESDNIKFSGQVSANSGGEITLSANNGTISLFEIDSFSSANIDTGDSVDDRLVQNHDFLGDLNSGNGGALEISAVSGDIDLSGAINTSSTFSLVSTNSNQNLFAGNIRSGKGGNIRFQTYNKGDIRLNENQIISYSETSISASGVRNLITGLLTSGEGGSIQAISEKGNIQLALDSLLFASSRVLVLEDDNNTTPIRLSGKILSGDAGQIVLSTTSGDIGAGQLLAYSRSEVEQKLSKDSNGSASASLGGSISLSTLSGNINLGNIDTFSYANISSAQNGGDVKINAPKGFVTGNESQFSRISTFSRGNPTQQSGEGGDVEITARDKISNLNIFTFSSDSRTEKKSGTINLTGQSNLEIENLDIVTSTDIPVSQNSSTSQRIDFIGIGQSGDANITSQGDLTIKDSEIINTAQSNDSAGQLLFQSAGSIVFEGESSVESDTDNTGNAGDIRFEAKNLTLSEGITISASTSNQGNAGDIIFNLTDSLNLDRAQVTASTSPNSTGEGGNIFTSTPPQQINLNQSTIAVNSQGTGSGGNINLTSRGSLSLAQGSEISAATASNDGGNVNLKVADTLRLSDQSNITAAAAQQGNGGQVNIDAQFILGLPEGPNTIETTAEDGDGGQINISTEAIFGDRFLNLDASSESGNDGSVLINGLNTNPTQSLTQPSTPFSDTNNQLANACPADLKGRSQFIVTGRGGLPQMPTNRPLGLTLTADLGPLAIQPSLIPVASQHNSPIQIASTDQIVIQSPSATSLDRLLKDGGQAYHQANYTEAVSLWTQAATHLEQSRDRLAYASTLANLALAYHHLGDWERATLALKTSRESLTPAESTADSNLFAQLLNTQAHLQFNQGKIQAALQGWQQATATYEATGNPMGKVRSQLNQAQALQSLGDFNSAKTLLQSLTAPKTSPEKAQALMLLGNIQRASGELQASDTTLKQALAIAQSAHTSPLISAILLNLGHTAQALNQPDAAITYYQQSQAIAPTPMAQFQATVSQVALLSESKTSPTSVALASLTQTIPSLPLSRDSLFAQLFLAQSLINQPSSLPSSEILALLQEIQDQARSLQDPISQAYTLGFQGELSAKMQQWSLAQTQTEQALQILSTQQVPEVTYRLQWQLGRIHQAQNNSTAAITAYAEAAQSIKILRNDLVTTNREIQFNFRDTIEPLYREYVSLLLHSKEQNNAQQTNLKQALGIFDELQVAELEDFLSCNLQTQTTRTQDTNATFIYPILLPDRIEVILQPPQNQPLVQYSAPIPSAQMTETLKNLRRELEESYPSQRGLQLSQQLYDWIIRPGEHLFRGTQMNTLVFVSDSPLRNIPMAALHDGKQYLLEKGYSIAQLPSRSLFESSVQPSTSLKSLSFGLANGSSPLPEVSRELDAIQKLIDSKQYLDDSFSSQNFKNQILTSSRPILHLATHGLFSSDPDNTYIEAWDKNISGNELSQVLSNRNQDSNLTPIELLVLSACHTASGDRRAILGLAGIAVKSGTRSTLASLWAVDDRATAMLMEEFYRQLSSSHNISKAEALRRAQIKVIQTPGYNAPKFWSPYILVGDWQ